MLDFMAEDNRSEPDSTDVAGQADFLRRLSANIAWHVCPVGMLAHSRTNLAGKLRIVLRTLGLLCSCRSELVEFCNNVISIHTGYGTEKGISRVEGCRLDDILPYFTIPIACIF